MAEQPSPDDRETHHVTAIVTEQQYPLLFASLRKGGLLDDTAATHTVSDHAEAERR